VELRSLADQPFALLLELERRAREAMSAAGQSGDAAEEWVGIAFRIGGESFVASRSDVREVMPLPASMTRVPGAKPWLRGVTNVRGELLTVVDLRGFLGAGGVAPDRHARVLVLASRDVPTGLLVDQVFGFRRFSLEEFVVQSPTPVLRCEQYLRGAYHRWAETWPRFDFSALLEDENFLNAGEGS
jgi:twitching motility protein PilI